MRKTPAIALTLATLALAVAPFVRAADETAAKTWFFTTHDTLTIDVRLPAEMAPDWTASRITLTRAGHGEATESITATPDAGRATFDRERNLWRITTGPLKVTPWAPASPALYKVVFDIAGKNGRRETLTQRIGFRSFETKEGKLWLNGHPIFLRGLAINPPGRGIPKAIEESRAFALDYVGFMLRHNVNIIRIPDDPTWYDVCDELGMMVFGGNYAGIPQGLENPATTTTPAPAATTAAATTATVAAGGEPPSRVPPANRDNAEAWYRETKFHPVSHHPSLVIYALTNEMPWQGSRGELWHSFLSDIYQRLRQWDSTRLYIANAGYGLGRTGDICDLHRYWGWYYSSPFTFLHLRDAPMVTFPEKTQPLTFTECVGNYGGPDGRINLSPNHKNPVSQQNWTGHAPQRDQARHAYEHQSFTLRQAAELFRRLRSINGELSGVFPFTIPFHNWHTISAFDEMLPRPVTQQMRASYQPVLLSWELHTTQVYAGATIAPVIHVVNDANDFSDLRDATLRHELRDTSETVLASGEIALPLVPYYAAARHPLTLTVPENLSTGEYHLHGCIEKNGAIVTQNRATLFVASPSYVRAGTKPRRPIRLIDPEGATQKALERLGIRCEIIAPDAAISADAPAAPVIVGENAVATLDEKQIAALASFAKNGGRVVVLRQPAASAATTASAAASAATSSDALNRLNRLLPVKVMLATNDLDSPDYPPPRRPSRQGMNINPERPDHPVFAGIGRERLRTWSDYTGWDETKPGLPRVYPVNDSFVFAGKTAPAGKAALATTAVLANHSVGLEATSLAEFFTGKGSVMLCAFDLAARSGLDPVADRLLANLAGYAESGAGHDPHVLIDSPIIWGEYDTERGVLTGINSGLMLNSRPALTGSYRETGIMIHPDGHQFAGGPGGWNTRPGIQYVPFGRRPFGPYIHASWAGTPAVVNKNSREGEGRFWCRIPAGKTKAVHRVWNPAAVPLPVTLAANGKEITVTLQPDARQTIEVPLAANTTTVENSMRGDRRLVLLETAFE
jgi:hypothetical protein